MSAARVLAKDLRPRDLLRSGSTVLGVVGLVRGGVKVWIETLEQEQIYLVLNGRRLHEVERPETDR